MRHIFYDSLKRFFVALTAMLVFIAPAFSVAALPDGYTELQYIETTGTQYILLPTFPTASKIDITVDVQHTTGTNEQIFFAPASGIQYLYTTSNGWRVWKSGVSSATLGNSDVRHLFVIKTTSSGVEYWVDDVKNTNVPSGLYTSGEFSNKKLNMGARTRDGGAGDFFWKGKIYSFMATCDGQVCMNLVPAKNASGVIGMYDLADSNSATAFHTNAGTGTFTAGPDVPKIKIATTKYTEDAFANLVTTLESAINKVTNIVDTTVQQATEIGVLAETKQDRPDTDCPAGRKCLLIMGADNKPHWYLIQE